MIENTTLQKGDKVMITFAWTEHEIPTAANFHSGKITQIIKRSEFATYYRISGLKTIIPADRVKKERAE